MIKDQVFIALDLELYTEGENSPTEEIIEVGVVLASPNWEKSQWIKKHWLIDIDKPLSEFIIKLTGITQEEMDSNKVSLTQCAKELSELLDSHKENLFFNPVVWGGSDSKELKEAFKQSQIEFPHFGHREIDVKTIATFLRLSKGVSKPLGLSKAMGQFKLPFEGTAHRATVDAYNTLRFFFSLLKRQENLESSLSFMKEITN